MRTSSVIFAAVLATAPAFGQNVQNIHGVASRATMIVSGGEYKSCGLRFVGIDIDPAHPAFPAHGWDFNITIGHAGPTQLISLLKTEVSRVQGDLTSIKNSQLLKVAETWLQPEGAAPIKPYRTGVAGENGLSSMSGYPFEMWADELLAIAKGEGRPLLLGVRLASEKATRIYRFEPKLNQEDAKAYVQCVSTMAGQLQRQLESK